MQKINLIYGDAIEILNKIDSNSIDLIFADPPYNLSGENYQTCKSGKMSKCNKGDWDQIENIDLFNETWISECIINKKFLFSMPV
ncbi:MAG TPA: hypothetical protein PKI83_06555, partial [Bacteroidales bacterium]|nr:hypothetical protein [Bacteroidales bacterium]